MKTEGADPLLDWHAQPEGSILLPLPPADPELTQIPLKSAVFKLAWPAIGSMLFIMIFNLVDVWYVSKLGAEPLAGVSAASFILWALQSISMIISEGACAMVARFMGAGDNRSAGLVIGQSLILATGIAVLNSIVGLVLVRKTLMAMGLEGIVLQNAMDYLSYLLYGLVFLFLTYTIDAVFRGMGDTKTPLKIIGGALLVNVALDPLLIFGIGPFPRMGAAGAGLATMLAHVFAFIWSWILLKRRDVHASFDRTSHRRINWSLMWRITKIGAPLALSGLLFSMSYMLLTRIISFHGPNALAALGLGHRIEGLCYNVAVGFSVAASTLVGQNLGAGKPERAEKAVWLNILYISIFLVFISLLFFFFGTWVIRFFINDAKVIAEGARYLRIIALFEVFLGFEIVFEGAFSGAGNTIPPMLISVPLTWARIPLALLLADTLGLGSSGIWWAIAVTTGLKGVIMAAWFRRGRWKEKQV
jgi:putative MATE family efflux protein